MAQSVTTAVVLSNLVAVMAIRFVGGVFVRIPPSQAVAMTVPIVLWLPVCIVVGRLLVVSTLIAHIPLRMSLIEVGLVVVVGVNIEREYGEITPVRIFSIVRIKELQLLE